MYMDFWKDIQKTDNRDWIGEEGLRVGAQNLLYPVFSFVLFKCTIYVLLPFLKIKN